MGTPCRVACPCCPSSSLQEKRRNKKITSQCSEKWHGYTVVSHVFSFVQHRQRCGTVAPCLVARPCRIKNQLKGPISFFFLLLPHSSSPLSLSKNMKTPLSPSPLPTQILPQNSSILSKFPKFLQLFHFTPLSSQNFSPFHPQYTPPHNPLSL